MILTKEQKDKFYLVSRIINEGYITVTDVHASTECENTYMEDYFKLNDDLFRIDKTKIFPTKLLIEIHEDLRV